MLEATGPVPVADVVVIDAASGPPLALDDLPDRIGDVPFVLVGATAEQLTPPPETPGGFAALSAGARGPAIAAAVVAVAHGLRVIDPAVTRAARPETGELAPRELEVLRLLAEGHANKRLALEIGISENAVKFHVSAVMAKLSAQSRTEAVTVAARRGLIAL